MGSSRMQVAHVLLLRIPGAKPKTGLGSLHPCTMMELGKLGLQRAPTTASRRFARGTSGGRIFAECGNFVFSAALSWFRFSSDDVMPPRWGWSHRRACDKSL